MGRTKVEEGVTGYSWRRLADGPPGGRALSLSPLDGHRGHTMDAGCLRGIVPSMLDAGDARFVQPKYNMRIVTRGSKHERWCHVADCGFTIVEGQGDRRGQYRCAFHAPNQPHNHSMEELFVTVAAKKGLDDLCCLVAKEGLLEALGHRGFSTRADLVVVRHAFAGRLLLEESPVPTERMLRDVPLTLHLAGQAPFEFTISLATMRPGWEVECTEGGWLVVADGEKRSPLGCEQLRPPGRSEGPTYPTVRDFPCQGIQRFYCVLSSQDWAEPFVVESGGCKIPVSLGAIAASVFKAFDGAEDRPAAALLVVGSDSGEITALASYDDMVEYATRTGVVERLFAGNGGAAARDLDSVLASPLPQTLSGIPVVAKVPKPPGAAAKVERQLELALRPPRRSVAIPGSAEAGLQRDALVAGARAQLTGTAAVAAVSAGSVAAQPPLGAAPASAAVAQRTCIAAGATGAAAATFAAAATAPAAQAGPVPPLSPQLPAPDRGAQTVLGKRQAEEAGAGGGAAPSKQGRLAGLASTAIDFAAWGLGSLMPRRP